MKKLFFISLSFLTINIAIANMGPQGFGMFLNKYFIETGTFGGDGILKALEAGFKEIRSIESDQNLFRAVQYRLRENKNVHIYYGDSSKDLWNMIKDVNDQMTFWLDAHIYPPRPDGGKNCPLLEELEQIKQHPIKSHTILIDDMHCTGTAAFDFLTKEDLIKKILEINPTYKISYVDGGNDGEYPNNVMVAMI